MIHLSKLRFLSIFLFLISTAQADKLYAQRQVSSQNHLWLALAGNHQLSDRWYLWTDVQARQSEFGLGKQQFIARTAFDYKFNSQFSAGLGYAFVKNWPYGEQPVAAENTENRIYTQAQLKQSMGTTELQHRYRLEHRVLSKASFYDSATNKYTENILVHRFRYRFQLAVPVGKQKDGKGFVAGFNNEVFLGFGKQQTSKNLLDQNRLYIFTGYKFSPASQIYVGYMNQWINKSDGIKVENNHTLLIMYNINLNLRKKANKP